MKQDRYSGIGRVVKSTRTGARLHTWNVDVREKWDLQEMAHSIQPDRYELPLDGGTVIRPFQNRDVVPNWRS